MQAPVLSCFAVSANPFDRNDHAHAPKNINPKGSDPLCARRFAYRSFGLLGCAVLQILELLVSEKDVPAELPPRFVQLMRQIFWLMVLGSLKQPTADLKLVDPTHRPRKTGAGTRSVTGRGF